MTRLSVLQVALAALVVAGCGSTHHAATSTPATGTTISGMTTVAATPAATPRCTTSALAVWLGLGEGGGTAGSTYYPLELSNTSNHACHLRGFPGVSAYRSHQLGSPARRNPAVPEHTMTLATGETAHTVLQFIDVGNLSSGQCAPVTATELRVIPPDDRTAANVPFSFRACSRNGPIYLTVQPVQPRVGIPGH